MDNWLLDLLGCEDNKNHVLITEKDLVDPFHTELSS